MGRRILLPAGLFCALLLGIATETLGYYGMLLPLAMIIAGVVVLASSRYAERNPAQITPNWVLVAAPTLIATTAISIPVGIAAIALLTGAAFWPRGTAPLTLTWSCAMLPTVALVIVLRPNNEHAEQKAVFFILACIVIARTVQISASKTSAIVSLLDGVGLFVVVSVVLWASGVTGNSTRTKGIDTGNTLTGGTRVIFPLSDSLASTGSMAAVYLAAALPLIFAYRQHRVARLVAAACAVVVLVLSDNRAAIIVGLVLSLCALAPQVFRRVAPWLVGIALIVPFVYEHIQDVISSALEALSSATPWLVRPTLRGRETIWTEAVAHYQHRVDWVHQMTGFGVGGQAESGASSYYGSRAQWEGYGGDVTLMSPHNSVLQILFDGGWVTASVISLVIASMAVVLSRNPTLGTTGLAILTALVVVSVAEVALSPSHMQPTWWILVALATIVFAKQVPSDSSVESSGNEAEADGALAVRSDSSKQCPAGYDRRGRPQSSGRRPLLFSVRLGVAQIG